MNLILALWFFLATTNLSAGTPAVATVVDYLRDTPASVMGNISLDGPLEIYKGKKGILNIGMKINPKKSIGYSFSDQHLSINSEAGISLTVQGIAFKVKSIYYHQTTGKFQVKTDTPLNIGESLLNKKIEQVLNTHYRPKVIQAFGELKKIRAQKNLQDVNNIISQIMNIFSTGTPAVPLPVIRGNVDLVFSPNKNENLKLDQWEASIKSGDHISLGMNFVRRGKSTTINAVEFLSQNGIRITGKTKYPEIASVDFRQMRADGNGINFNYVIGAEEVLTGFSMLMSVLKAHSGHPGDLLKECDPVRLESIRRSIDENLRQEIAKMIRLHRDTLLTGGVSPQLLTALD